MYSISGCFTLTVIGVWPRRPMSLTYSLSRKIRQSRGDRLVDITSTYSNLMFNFHKIATGDFAPVFKNHNNDLLYSFFFAT